MQFISRFLIGASLIGALLLVPWSVHAQSDASAPRDLTATIIADGVALSWDAPTEAATTVTGYEILRRRPRQGEQTLLTFVADTGSAVAAYTDRTATEPGERYVYRVKALRGGKKSGQSNFARVDIPEVEPPPTPVPTPDPGADPPAEPTGLSGTATHEAVTLTWEDSPDARITGYRVLRGPEGGTLTVIADDTGSDEPGYQDAEVAAATTYDYAVQALTDDSVSAPSGRVTVTTLATPRVVTVQARGQQAEEPLVAVEAMAIRGECAGAGDAPTPVAVEVTAIPIVVASTTADYFVLYVRHDLDADPVVELPVSVTLGGAGTTTLGENVPPLPKEHYRVDKFLVANPADVDGDCIDDITELQDPVGMNPINPAAATLALSDGAVAIPDRETFETLSYLYLLDDNDYVKFVLIGLDSDRPGIYFMNTNKHQAHEAFLDVVGLDPGLAPALITDQIIYDPNLVAPDGSQGVYYIRYSDSFDPDYATASRHYTLLAANMPLLADNLAFRVSNWWLPRIQSDLPLYRESRISLLFDEDVGPETDFLALNPGEGYGRLRVLGPDERPHSRDVVIYEALPNELSRVAGIISTVPQTPLSHVNLRAVQDAIPNAFIRDVLDDASVASLVDSYVRYEVTEDGWELRSATPKQVEAHYESSRPAKEQTPERDLSVTTIAPLTQIGFDDWRAFGVKAANLAVLGTLGFPEGTVRDGFAIPFYFYDEFMKAHDFYARIETMLADEDFQSDFEVQDDMLDDLRDDIKDAATPAWIINALTAMHATFPAGTSLRYRSSTNNEDLPGFNGAGLYDSKTQHPDETVDDGIDKSLKQVWASLWTFRAFSEREFHRIDHLAAAMGVLVHPNFSDELRNGVAVSYDPLYGRDGNYYVNTQLGEDLVTNPDAYSVPEEILIWGTLQFRVIATSNQVPPGQLLMSRSQLQQLYQHLEVIHDHFKRLYNPARSEPFAMEIEFKITSENVLAIKQARPWVFNDAAIAQPRPPQSPGPPASPGPAVPPGPAGPPAPPGPPAPAAPASAATPVGIIGSTPAATATELPGNRLRIERHDIPDAVLQLAIGSISADGTSVVMAGVTRDATLGQTYLVVRREADGRIVRRWVPPDSPFVYQIPWPIVNTQYTVPVGVVGAIPLDDQFPEPNLLVRRFDGGDDRIFGYDADLQQWRHVPDIPTFQTLGFYWCNVTAADAAFFARISPGPPYPASATPAWGDYPNCLTS